jgi:hypothetical protein
MKSNLKLAVVMFALALTLNAPANAVAQKQSDKQQPAPKVSSNERLEPDEGAGADATQTAPAGQRDAAGEDAQGEVPGYNNFFSSYRLGPEDVISI